MKEDEVEYELSDSEPKKPKVIIKSSEINTHEIGNEYVFFKYDYANDDISDETITFVLQGYNHITNFYFFKDPYGTKYWMLGIDKFADKTIVWEDTNGNYYICPQIRYDYIDNQNYCNFFIENLYYDFSVSRTEGISTSVKNARLLFDNKTLHDDLVVYIFILEAKHKFYTFIINEKDEFEFYGKKSDAIIEVRNGICDSPKIADICIDDLDDDEEDNPSEEIESNEVVICVSCGESFFKEEDDNNQTLCFYCRNTIAEMDESGIVYNPMEYPGYYDIKNVGNIDLNGRTEPQPIIITMFFGLHGHGEIVNSKDKMDIQFTTRGSEFAKPFTSGYQVELSTFKSKPSCRTHMICIGNPLFFSMADFRHNGITFNEEIDEIFSKKDANVNSVVHDIIKYETDFHNFSEKQLKNIYLTDDLPRYGKRTVNLAYKNHLKIKDRTWGIATNFGLTRTAIAEKYINGYSTETEKQNSIKDNLIMDPAVDVKKPIVRALYCNIYYQPTGVNSNKKIDEVILLRNNTTLSSVSTICEDYLVNFYKTNMTSNMDQKVELVSIIIDKSCNYSTADVVFPHIPVSPRIIGIPFHKKYNAKGKRSTRKQSTHKQSTYKRKRSVRKCKQSKYTRKKKQSK